MGESLGDQDAIWPVPPKTRSSSRGSEGEGSAAASPGGGRGRGRGRSDVTDLSPSPTLPVYWTAVLVLSRPSCPPPSSVGGGGAPTPIPVTSTAANPPLSLLGLGKAVVVVASTLQGRFGPPATLLEVRVVGTTQGPQMAVGTWAAASPSRAERFGSVRRASSSSARSPPAALRPAVATPTRSTNSTTRRPPRPARPAPSRQSPPFSRYSSSSSSSSSVSGPDPGGGACSRPGQSSAALPTHRCLPALPAANLLRVRALAPSALQSGGVRYAAMQVRASSPRAARDAGGGGGGGGGKEAAAAGAWAKADQQQRSSMTEGGGDRAAEAAGRRIPPPLPLPSSSSSEPQQHAREEAEW